MKAQTKISNASEIADEKNANAHEGVTGRRTELGAAYDQRRYPADTCQPVSFPDIKSHLTLINELAAQKDKATRAFQQLSPIACEP